MAAMKDVDFGYAPGILAALWVVLAFLRPEVTFHLGPVFVGASFPVSFRLRSGAVTARAALALFLGGAILVGLVTALLAIAGKLEGPSLLPSGGSAVEAYVFGTIAAALGAVVVAIWSDHS